MMNASFRLPNELQVGMPPGNLLDVGCAIYSVAQDIPGGCFLNYAGIDFQAGWAEKCKRTLQAILPEKELKFWEGTAGDVRNYQPEQQAFSLIVARDVLHFVAPEDRQTIFQRFRKALLPGGLLYLRIHRVGCPAIVQNPNWRRESPAKFHWKDAPAEKCFLAAENEIRKLTGGFEILEAHSDFNDDYHFEIFCRKQ